MADLITETAETEASKQAKLKGYKSIGFGRWVDKNGNMAAFTNKRGRLVPYQGKPDPEIHKKSSNLDDSPASFITPFVKTSKKTSNSHFTSARPKLGIHDVKIRSLRDKFDEFAAKYAAEALLTLLKWIKNKDLTAEQLKFYTSSSFEAYALVMKDVIVALNMALIDGESDLTGVVKKVGDRVVYDLDGLYQRSTIPEALLHIALVDLYEHGPSYIFAKSMKLEYAASADDYRVQSKVLVFNYSDIRPEESEYSETDPAEIAPTQH